MSGPRGGPLYKIVPTADWRDTAQQVPWAEVDRTDGYIHLSAAHQVRGTAAKHFAQHDALVLLEIDPRRLAPETLRWEVSRGGDEFPHVYGDIARSAVIGVDHVGRRGQGRHRFPTHVPDAAGVPCLGDALALRLERAEAGTLVALARAAERLRTEVACIVAPDGGGVAARFGPDAPINAIKGWGLPGTGEALDTLLTIFAGAGGFAVELPSFASSTAIERLDERGFRAVATEYCMVRSLPPTDRETPHRSLVPTTSHDRDVWSDLLFSGFAGETTPSPLRALGPISWESGLTETYFVTAEGERVGACAMRTDHEVAMLTGCAIAAPFRGQGRHLAAIHDRLERATALGCRYAKLDVAPGSASHRNACRAGFTLSHTRTAFARR